jgi:hypothetical protein
MRLFRDLVPVCVLVITCHLAPGVEISPAEPTAAHRFGASDEMPSVDALVKRLAAKDWTDSAARQVISFNYEMFTYAFDASPSYFDQQFKGLEKLGSYQRIMPTLSRWPETSGLFVMAVDYGDKQMVDNLIRSLDAPDPQTRQTIGNMFMAYTDYEGVRLLAQYASRYQSQLARLYSRGNPGSESLFLRPLDNAGNREFSDWAFKELSRLEMSHDKYAAFIAFMGECGDMIAERFRSDPSFPRLFINDYWPLLKKIVQDDPRASLEAYVAQPGIWNFLKRERREALLRRLGPPAIALLEGNERFYGYPPELQRKVEDFILEGDDAVITTLFNYQSDSLFFKLLKRNVPTGTLRSAAAELANLPSHRANERLRYWGNLRDNPLIEELGPPPDGPVTWLPFYDTVCVPWKWMDGREIGTFELISAVIDPAFLAIDLISLGGGRAVKTGLKGAAKVVYREITESAAKSAARAAGGRAAKSGVQAVIRQTAGEIAEWMVKKTAVDITNLVRGLYGGSGAGRNAFKKLIGLEARLFMRGDARVVVVPVALLKGAARVTADDAIAGLVLGSALDTEAGENLVRAAIGKLLEVRESARENLESWRKHASVWWLMNAVQPPPEIFPARQ